MKHAEAYTELHCAFFNNMDWIKRTETTSKKNNTNIAMISSPSI